VCNINKKKEKEEEEAVASYTYSPFTNCKTFPQWQILRENVFYSLFSNSLDSFFSYRV
jgi:hypothetical protein